MQEWFLCLLGYDQDIIPNPGDLGPGYGGADGQRKVLELWSSALAI